MLRQAILAGIPIITCRTSDVINLGQVLAFVSDGAVQKWTGKIADESLYYCIGVPEGVGAVLYSKLVDQSSSLIIVNPDDQVLEAFDAGEVPVPELLVESHLEKVVGKDQLAAYMRAVSGLTIKQIVEVVRLTEVEHGYLDPRKMMKTRSMLAGKMQGLAPVDTQLKIYVPDPQLAKWVEENTPFFVEMQNVDLVPKGIMLEGVPGVGKTQAAKYIANAMEVPLYRMDLSSSLGKYVGESESNLSRALATIDQEEPCVLLIDEVEKLFAEKEDSGVTTRLLAQLLWWLQEHTSRVLTVMTTNDSDKLPKELYRSGRIDDVFVIQPLSVPDAQALVKQWLMAYFPDKPVALLEKWSKYVNREMPHAEAVGIAKKIAKEKWEKNI